MFIVAKAMGIRAKFFFQMPFCERHWVFEDISDISRISSNAALSTSESFVMNINSKSQSERDSQIQTEFLDAALGESKFWYMNGTSSSVSYHSDSPTRFIYFPLQLEPELTVAALGGGGLFSHQLTSVITVKNWCDKNN